jgi:hypothetical protein
VLDGPLQRALGVLDVDAGESIGTVEHEVHLLLLVAEEADCLEHESNVLEAGQVGRHHDEDRVGRVEARGRNQNERAVARSF